jgi:hypothetical protein
MPCAESRECRLIPVYKYGLPAVPPMSSQRLYRSSTINTTARSRGNMGMAAATAPLLLVALLMLGTAAVRASHVVYPELQSLEAEHVDETSRTGYHFQPPKHWINGMTLILLVRLFALRAAMLFQVIVALIRYVGSNDGTLFWVHRAFLVYDLTSIRSER